MFIKSAETMEYELENTAQKITSLMEPIIIIIMGGIIGFIAISILLPIFKLNSVIGG
jgi:type II secretory pathway component PulF